MRPASARRKSKSRPDALTAMSCADEGAMLQVSEPALIVNARLAEFSIAVFLRPLIIHTPLPLVTATSGAPHCSRVSWAAAARAIVSRAAAPKHIAINDG